MIKIQIERESRQVDLEKGFLGNDNENLQETLEFTFTDEFVDGQARLETIINGEKSFINLDKQEESYTIPVTNIMTKKGKVDCQLVITEGTDTEEIPLFKSNIFYFYVGESINAETGSPEPYIEWIDRANIKLNQIDNLDIEATKEDTTTTITITKKDGTEQSVEILDGEKGDKGDAGPAGAIKTLIVNQLPTTGEEGTLYFVPKQDTETSDIYDEYMWVNNDWEHLGEKKIVVDLTDYVKNTDYATSSKGGVIKTGFELFLANGKTACATMSYGRYQQLIGLDENHFISNGTLNNVLNATIGDISSVLDAINGEVI